MTLRVVADVDSMDPAAASTSDDYQLRIFLSVDLVGSTAFKFSNELEDNLTEPDGSSPRYGWLSTIKKFYNQFHQDFLERFNDDPSQIPMLWKALGDELIYVGEVMDRSQVAVIVERFIAATQTASKLVRAISPNLDCKSTAWLADFPARNAVVGLEALHRRLSAGEVSGTAPVRENGQARRDYIGPSMDAGFRLGKLASHRKFIVSVELAYVLALTQSESRKHPFTFGYDGREDLKGVLGGESYPILWLDIEDDADRRTTNRREAAMLQRQAEVPCDTVADFCHSYIRSAPWMEVPLLKDDLRPPFNQIPPSLSAFKMRQEENLRKEQTLYNENEPEIFEQDDPPAPNTSEGLLDEMPNPEPFSDEPESAA